MSDLEIRKLEQLFQYMQYGDVLPQFAITQIHSLLQQYLSIKGMPEERPREIDSIQSEDFLPYIYHNRCLKQCKLAVMKMFSVERIDKVMRENDVFNYMGICRTDSLIEAIHNLIGEKE